MQKSTDETITMTIRYGDILEIDGRQWMAAKVSVAGKLTLLAKEPTGGTSMSDIAVDGTVVPKLIRSANMVQSTMHWANGTVTAKTFDIRSGRHRLEFSRYAALCYDQNGTVTTVGVNAELVTMRVQDGRTIK